MSYKKWLVYAKNFLKKNKIINYQFESEVLLSFVTKRTIENIIINENKFLKYKQFLTLEYFLNARKNKISIYYILKKINFYSINFIVDSKVFIPRPETECLVDFILQIYNNNNNYNIIDLGTGIGSIAISLAKNLSNSNIIGIDLNKNAIKMAKINSKILNLKNVFFYKNNWINLKLNKKFNLIISNPPYISKNEFKYYKFNLINEPINSIISKKNGLYDIEYIINNFKNNLTNNGYMIIEHSNLQGFNVRKLFKFKKYRNINTYCDFNGNERFTSANN